MKTGLWPKIRRVWIATALVATAGFVSWSLVATRASGAAHQALESDTQVSVTRADDHWQFSPRVSAPERAGLLFFPGALVDPVAYAPIARDIARAGHVVALVVVPRRGLFGGADGSEVAQRASAVIQRRRDITRWVAAGHSRGGVIAARLVREGMPAAALVLIATSHPRDFSLAHLTIPVVKILGTHDGIAEIEKSERNRHLLPSTARWVILDGANHSQFGWYGFQPGDSVAAITRARQHELTTGVLLDVLRDVK